MNNTCPACGTVYTVSPNDIGRRVRCKRCNASLMVGPEGLMLALEAATAAPVPADTQATFAPYPASLTNSPIAIPGSISTILFALGVFLVIFFTYMTPIGEAAARRAQGRLDQLKLDQERELRRLLPPGKDLTDLRDSERRSIEDQQRKIRDDYQRKLEDARIEAEQTRISNIRSQWFDRYGQLFGFILLAFGCLGYLRTEQPLTLRIVAAVVLGSMLLLMFALGIGGCQGLGGPSGRG